MQAGPSLSLARLGIFVENMSKQQHVLVTGAGKYTRART